MAYLGITVQTPFTSLDRQDLTGSTGTGPFTLTHAVANENEVQVFIGNVRQEPGVAYTCAGNQITLTGSVAATDDFYVIFSAKALQTAVPAAGSITQSMFASGLSLGAGYFDGNNGAAGDTTNGKGDIFRVHSQTLTNSVTIGSTDNAMAVGPLTIDSSVTLTVNGNLTVV